MDPRIDLHIGDCIDILPTLKEKVNVIYIDPPYNTGKNIFLYNDKRKNWEQYIYERIQASYELLNANGVLLASINDQEHHTLRVILDNIFGSKNFLSTIVWSGNGSSQSKFSRGGIDYIIAYAKDRKNAPSWVEKKERAQDLLDIVNKAKSDGLSYTEAQKVLRAYINKNKNISKGLSSYSYVDENYDVYTTSSIVNHLYRPNLKYTIIDKQTGREYPSPNNGWTLSKDLYSKLESEGRIVFKGNRPRKKIPAERNYVPVTLSFYKRNS